MMPMPMMGKGDWKGMMNWFSKGSGGKGASSRWAPSKEEDEPSRMEPAPNDNIYVKHLPVGITEEQVRKTFEKVGSVEELRIMEYALEYAALVRMPSVDHAAAARTNL